jgi:heme/copper-type cytochrome/quinol oxidase subunit 1
MSSLGGNVRGVCALWRRFWFFDRPEIYILILPGLEVISPVVSALSGKSVAGPARMVYVRISIRVLGFVVWVHHMYTAVTWIYFTPATRAIAVPAGPVGRGDSYGPLDAIYPGVYV